MVTGINTNTPKNLLLDTGAFYAGFDIATDTVATASAKLLGATSGGAKFDFKVKYRNIKADGVKGDVKGLKLVESWEVTMEASMLEFKKETLEIAIGASKTSTTTINTKNYDKIEGKSVLEDTDYETNITWIGTLSGNDEPVIIQIFNALNDEGLKFGTKDNDDNTIDMKFVGHSTIATLNEPPFAIYYPGVTV